MKASLLFLTAAAGCFDTSSDIRKDSADPRDEGMVVAPIDTATDKTTVSTGTTHHVYPGAAGEKPIATALRKASCGDTIMVHPGDYPEYIQFGVENTAYVGAFECSEAQPLVIQAASPVVADWDRDGIGAGALSDACTLDADTLGYSCDPDQITTVQGFRANEVSTDSQTNSGIHIIGFDVSADGWPAGINLLNCSQCRIERNFIRQPLQQCILLSTDASVAFDSNDNQVAGNHLYRCGGGGDGSTNHIPTAGTDINIVGSARADVHHNDMYGSGQKSTLTENHGTSGVTVHSIELPQGPCGARIWRNRIYNHVFRYENYPAKGKADLTDTEQAEYRCHVDDGIGINIKHANCAGTKSPIQIYENEVFANHGRNQVWFEYGADGILFYNNRVTDGSVVYPEEDAEFCSKYFSRYENQTTNGVNVQAGGTAELGGTHDIREFWVFNNIIANHSSAGLVVSSQVFDGSPERYRLDDVRVFGNTIVDNAYGGLYVRLSSDEDSPLQIINNVLSHNNDNDFEHSSISPDLRHILTGNLIESSPSLDADDAAFSGDNITEDALLDVWACDPSGESFGLSSDSPGIGIGVDWCAKTHCVSDFPASLAIDGVSSKGFDHHALPLASPPNAGAVQTVQGCD